MKAWLRFTSYVVLSALIIAAAIAIFDFEYGTPVSRRGLMSLAVTDHSTLQPATVSVDGAIVNSSMAVYGVRQHRTGSLVVIVVRQGLVRKGHQTGRFHCDVSLSGGVEQIALGEPHEIIWHR
jgi:hypothetical protein